MQIFTLYDEFIADKKIAMVSPKTIDFYNDSAYRWLEWCEAQERYERSDVDALQRWAKLYMLSLIERELSPYTIHTYGRGIRTFIKWAITEEYMAGPYKFKCPPKPTKDIRPLDLGAARNALAEIANQDSLVAYRNTVIMHNRVWVGEKGEIIGLRAVQSFMARLKKRIKYEGKLSPHILRHTYAILFLEKGGNTAALQDLMGHSDPETTMEYANFSRSQTKRIATRYSPGSDL